MQIYPNPTNGKLTIECAEWTNEDGLIEIYSIVGQLLQTGIVNLKSKITINVSHLAKGIYYVRIADKTAKFVKE